MSVCHLTVKRAAISSVDIMLSVFSPSGSIAGDVQRKRSATMLSISSELRTSPARMAVACAMLFDNVVLHLLRLDTPAFLHIVPFLFLLSLELLVLVRGVWRRKRGYGILVGYGVLCCLAALFVYRQWERFILDYYLVREGVYGFPVKAIYLLVCMAIGAVLLLFLLHWLNMFLGKCLENTKRLFKSDKDMF